VIGVLLVTHGEIGTALARPVVQDLIDLIRLRNTHPAFNGRFELLASHEAVLDMRWTAGAALERG